MAAEYPRRMNEGGVNPAPKPHHASKPDFTNNDCSVLYHLIDRSLAVHTTPSRYILKLLNHRRQPRELELRGSQEADMFLPAA